MADQIIIELIGDPSGLKPAEDALKQLSKVSEENKEAFNKANEAFARFTSSANIAGKAAEDLSDNSKDAAKALEGIGTSANKSITAISGLNGIIAIGAVKTATADMQKWSKEVSELTTKKQTLQSRLTEVNNELKRLNGTAGEGTQHYKKLAKESGVLEGKIERTNKALADEATKLNASAKAAAAASNAADKGGAKFKLLANGIKEGGKSTAELLGHTKDLAAAMGEAGEAIAHATGNEEAANEIKKQTAIVIQAISIAQGVATVATEATTVATTLFGEAAATAWASATMGISVLIGAVVALAGNIKSVTGWLKNLFSPLTVQLHNKELQDTIIKQQKLSDEASKQVALMEALGKSAAEINAKKQEQLTADQKLLHTQLDLAESQGDIDKAKELRNKLEETTLGIIRLQTEAIKAQREAVDEDKNKRKEEYAKYLSDAKDVADARLAITQAGSKEELNAKIADLHAAAAVELNNAKGNAAMIAAIWTKLRQDTTAAQKEFALQKLQVEKTDLEASLSLNSTNEKDKLGIRKQILEIEHTLEISRANLTANQKLLIDQEYEKKKKALDDEASVKAAEAEEAQRVNRKEALKKETDALKDADKSELNAQISLAKAKLANEDAYSADAIQTKKNMLADQMQMQIDEATASITNEKERAAKITEIQAQYQKDCKQLDDDKTKHEKENADKILAEKKDAAKKQEAIAKQVAAAAIEAAKQVSDAIFANAQQRRDNELKATEDNLNAQKNAELLNTTLTASQRQAIERKYKAEEAQAKLKAWKADQKAKEEQALINGLLAFTTALAQQGYPAGLVTGLLALAQAGVQAGIIASKTPPKFATGVIDLQGPGTATSDSIPALLSRGESVMTADETRRFKPALEAMRAGSFMDSYIPKVSLHSLLDGTGATLSRESIDYEKLGKVIAKNTPHPVSNNIVIDKNGFKVFTDKGGNRTEFLNNNSKL